MMWVGVFLLVNAAFSALVWSRLYARIDKDERSRDENGKKTKFYKVHAALYSIELLLAITSVTLGVSVLAGWVY